MQLRLSLTISGAVALGAYEGGALAALLHAVRPLAGDRDAAVRLDAIGGASAGSITGLLAARSLLEGLDPVRVMKAAWVEDDGIATLRGHDSQAPLSVDPLRKMATDLLAVPAGRALERQSTPVQLSFVLACLRGLDYTLPALHARQPVVSTTFVDYFDAELKAGADPAELVNPSGASLVDAALASAANALGFPPYLIDRRSLVAQTPNPYRAVQNWPSSGQLWYTDGGTLDNEPLGRTLDLTNKLDAAGDDFSRIQLLIHPHPAHAPTGGAWADPSRQPTWLETLLRSFSLQRTQSLFTDLKQVEKTNSRLAWSNDLSATLGAVLDELPDGAKQATRDVLVDVLARMRGQRAALSAASTDAAQAHPADLSEAEATRQPSELLREAVDTAANVGGKTDTAVEVISPLVLPEARTLPVEKMLSGEFLFHFGGFLDKDLRQADFDLGYSSTLRWLSDGGLRGHGRLDDSSATQALEAARAAYQPDDTWRHLAETTFGSLSTMDKLQALRLAAHITRVVTGGLVKGGTQQ